jgi:hypothetical protein
VPDEVVGRGLSRSFLDNTAGIATWLDAREPSRGGDLTGRRSLRCRRSARSSDWAAPVLHRSPPRQYPARCVPDRPVTQGIPRSPTDSPPPSGIWQLSGEGTHPLLDLLVREECTTPQLNLADAQLLTAHRENRREDVQRESVHWRWRAYLGLNGVQEEKAIFLPVGQGHGRYPRR